MPLSPPSAVAEPEEGFRAYTLYSAPHMPFAIVLKYGITTLLFTICFQNLQQFPSGAVNVLLLAMSALPPLMERGREGRPVPRRVRRPRSQPAWVNLW